MAGSRKGAEAKILREANQLENLRERVANKSRR